MAGQRWYSTTFGSPGQHKKSEKEDQKEVPIPDEILAKMDGRAAPDRNETEEGRDWYDYICEPDETYVEYENAEAYLTFLILARKWQHQNGTTNKTGLCWEEVNIFLKYNFKKKKRKNLFNDILLIEYGGLQAENQNLSEKRS